MPPTSLTSPASPASPDSQLIDLRGFVLGTASEAETEAFTLRFLSEDEALMEALADEDDLLDEYVRDELDADLARRFEEAVLVHDDEGRRRLAFARELKHRADAPRVSERSWWQRWIAGITAPVTRPVWAFCLLLLLVVAWQTARLARLEAARPQASETQFVEAPGAESSALLARLEAETLDLQRQLDEATEQSETLRVDLERLSAKAAEPSAAEAPRVFAIVLAAVTRGSRVPHFKIPAETQRVELQVDLSGGPAVEIVRARLLDDQGFQLWGLPRVETAGAAGSTAVRLPVPTEVLRPGSYSLRLESPAALAEVGVAEASVSSEPLELAAFDFRVDGD